MFGRKIAILFLMIAQVFILGHEFVPHHHHNELSNQHHEHTSPFHDSDSKNHHPDENSLQLALSNFAHSGEQVTFTHSNSTKVVVKKDNVQLKNAVSLSFEIPVNYSFLSKKCTFPPLRQIVYQPPLFGTHSLRGPPTLNFEC